jgi:hypothetical protein
VLDYAVGMSRTPVDVSDALCATLREHFDAGYSPDVRLHSRVSHIERLAG